MFASRLVVFSNGEKGKSMVTYCGSVLFAFFIGPPAKGSGNWELETGTGSRIRTRPGPGPRPGTHPPCALVTTINISFWLSFHGAFSYGFSLDGLVVPAIVCIIYG